jgi:hypothetical protein
MITTAYKVLTHDYQSPVLRGDPIFDGKLPFTLPRTYVDTSATECAAGWNACRAGHTALSIAGLWADGWPARLYRVETDEKVIERGDKLRAETWTLVKQVDIGIRDAYAYGLAYALPTQENELGWAMIEGPTPT